MSKDERILKTQTEIGHHFGVSNSTVRKWRADGMPGKPGRYDLDDIERWKAARRQDGKNGSPASAANAEFKTRLLEAQAKEKEAEARMKQRKADLEEGRWVEHHLVENFVSKMNQYTRDELLRLPVEMQAGFPKEHRRQLVEDMTERLKLFLKGLAAWQRRVTEL